MVPFLLLVEKFVQAMGQCLVVVLVVQVIPVCPLNLVVLEILVFPGLLSLMFVHVVPHSWAG